MGEFFAVVAGGIVAILISVVAEKTGRKALTITIGMLLGVAVAIIGALLGVIWLIILGGVVFIGPLFYIQTLIEERARKKKEHKEKEKEADQDST